MLETIERAGADDFEGVWRLYSAVCEDPSNENGGPHWTLGVYPTREDVAGHLEAGDLYVGRHEGRIVAAMVVVGHEDPEYLDVPWPSGTAPEDVGVIHLLAVDPAFRGHRAGAALVQGAIEIARAAGKRALHLDAIPGNVSASRLYLAAGFEPVGTREVFYEDTGRVEVELYELVL